ncbi:MAG: A/G-specific adenine glycosylase [Firmicutes bacterium]|nr:A/G-specific adenine glycosylase [Bacillota bacterium]
MDSQLFVRDLLAWYETDKRDLPWRKDADPYRVWVSEVMLQQTRVDTVIPYFERFMDLFPTVAALANASEGDVVKAWEGLGYYSRVRNLQQAVREVSERYNGIVPDSFEAMTSLRGVGPYTAGAVLSIAYGKPLAAVDGNVLRVISRLHKIEEDIAKPATKKQVEAYVSRIVPHDQASAFNQALMELGALVCTARTPRCESCPVARHCVARAAGCQARLPVKAAKKPARREHYAVLLLRRQDGSLAVLQRPDKGLLRGLWQLPMVAVEDAVASPDEIRQQVQGCLADYGIAESLEVGGVYTHAFTHLHWTLRVVRTDLLDGATGGDWIFSDAMDRAQMTFGRIFQIILQQWASDPESRPERKGGEQLALFHD